MSEVAQAPHSSPDGHSPQLRFPEFKEPYRENKLSNILKRYSAKNSDEEFGIDDILSLSSKYGIVDRKSLLEDTYDKVNHLAYIKTRLNDFVYGKSISSSYPYGLFKVNNCRDGLLSTLYFTFQVFEDFSPQYLDKYFSHFNRANNFLKKYVLVGDRYITADSNYILSGTIYTPTKPEQQKIAAFLSAVDNKIEQISKKQELLGEYKKGLMQKIFSQEIRFKADDGGDFPDWKEKKLGDYLTHKSIKNKDINIELVLSVSNKKGFITQDEQFEGHQVASKDLSNYKIVEKGEYAYNPSRISVGSIARLKNHSVGVVSPMYVIFKLKQLDAGFFDNLYQTHYFKHLIKIGCSGSVRDSLNFNDMADFLINLPSLSEQTKIANFLSSIDSKIEQVGEQLDKSIEFKKALLQQMFV